MENKDQVFKSRYFCPEFLSSNDKNAPEINFF